MAESTKSEAPKPNGKKAAEKEPLSIARGACFLAEQKRNAWEIELPVGTKPEELLRPAAWAAVARDFVPKDLVFAQPTDGAWLQVFRVRDVWMGGAQLVPLLPLVELPPALDHDDHGVPGYSIARDDATGWTITRESDGVRLACQRDRPDLTTASACRRYVEDHRTVRQHQ